jgi:sorbitol-specific phosphotransferase system component IIBC
MQPYPHFSLLNISMLDATRPHPLPQYIHTQNNQSTRQGVDMADMHKQNQREEERQLAAQREQEPKEKEEQERVPHGRSHYCHYIVM